LTILGQKSCKQTKNPTNVGLDVNNVMWLFIHPQNQLRSNIFEK